MLLLYLSALETEEEKLKMAQIYEHYRPLMFNYARKILQNDEPAEDAVHESFLSIIKHKEKYLSKACLNLGVPIVIIVRNKCYDMLKKADNKSENIDDYTSNLKSETMQPDDSVMLDVEYATLRNHISKLDESSKNILEMRYVADMSHKEISAITGMSLANINKKISRAKLRIREFYAEEEQV